jgi:hypothetical protein
MNKPYFCEGSDAMVQLESMVDAVGLSNVLYALSKICSEKASHLESNWQDKIAAKAWDREAKRLDIVATKVDV